MMIVSKERIKIKTSKLKDFSLILGLEEFVINFIVPIAFLIVSFGIIYFYLLPAYKRIPLLESEAKTKINEVSVLNAKVDQLVLLEENKDLVIQDLVKMSWALEERDKVPELTEQVMLMSKDAGLDFKSLDYANTNKDIIVSVSNNVPEQSSSLTPDPKLYREEKINVSLESKNLSSVVNFLKISENSVRLFKVESLRISLANNAAEEDKINQVNKVDLIMASPYLNPAFSAHSQTVAPIDLKSPSYRQFMQRLDEFRNYAKEVDSTLPNI